MLGKYKGQSKVEFDKNYKRVADIVEKSNGDIEKQNHYQGHKPILFVMKQRP